MAETPKGLGFSVWNATWQAQEIGISITWDWQIGVLAQGNDPETVSRLLRQLRRDAVNHHYLATNTKIEHPNQAKTQQQHQVSHESIKPLSILFPDTLA